GVTFVNDIGFGNGGSCIRLTRSSGAHIVNTTCYHDGLDTTALYHDENFFSGNTTTRTHRSLRNNLAVASAGHRASTPSSGRGPSVSQNNVFLDTGAATPFFADPGALDFHLVAGSTTVVDKGTPTEAPADDIGFDPRCLKPEPGQALWWQWAIDDDYIRQ